MSMCLCDKQLVMVLGARGKKFQSERSGSAVGGANTLSWKEVQLRMSQWGTEFINAYKINLTILYTYRGADKSLGPPGRKQATATEDFEFHISYL